MSARRVGMSRLDSPGHLLSFIDGKSREKLSQTVADDAQPLSSGDEDNDEKPPNGFKRRSEADSSESEPERATRGQIKRTEFGSSTTAKGRGTGIKRSSYSKARDLIAEEFEDPASLRTKRRKLDRAGSDEPSPTTSEPRSSLHTDNLGFTKRRQVVSSYGKRNEGSSQDHKATKGKPKAAIKFRAPDDDLSSPKRSSRRKVIEPEDPLTSSPPKKAPRRITKGKFDPGSSNPDILKSPQQKPVFKRVESSSQGSAKSTKRKGLWAGRGSMTDAPPPKITIEKVKKPRAKLVIPSEIPQSSRDSREDADVESLLSDLTPLSSESSTEAEASEPEPELIEGQVTKCPWCEDPVEEKLLKEFSKGKRLNVRMQTKFCRQHKRNSAMDTWRERHYPTVQWSSLEDRFDDHRDFLLRVVEGESSHFRIILADKIESGRAARSLKKEDNLNPGYYGPRGFNVMCDYLVNEFGEMLKERAVSDRVIAGRGSAAFIQSVLVAELAVRLIQEDMGVSSREAREIMEESKALGEMVNEEV